MLAHACARTVQAGGSRPLYNPVMRTHLAPLAVSAYRAVAKDRHRRAIERRIESGIELAEGAVRRVAADVEDLQSALRDSLEGRAEAVAAPLARSRRTRALAIGALVVALVAVAAVVLARRRRQDEDGTAAGSGG